MPIYDGGLLLQAIDHDKCPKRLDWIGLVFRQITDPLDLVGQIMSSVYHRVAQCVREHDS